MMDTSNRAEIGRRLLVAAETIALQNRVSIHDVVVALPEGMDVDDGGMLERRQPLRVLDGRIDEGLPDRLWRSMDRAMAPQQDSTVPAAKREPSAPLWRASAQGAAAPPVPQKPQPQPQPPVGSPARPKQNMAEVLAKRSWPPVVRRAHYTWLMPRPFPTKPRTVAYVASHVGRLDGNASLELALLLQAEWSARLVILALVPRTDDLSTEEAALVRCQVAVFTQRLQPVAPVTVAVATDAGVDSVCDALAGCRPGAVILDEAHRPDSLRCSERLVAGVRQWTPEQAPMPVVISVDHGGVIPAMRYATVRDRQDVATQTCDAINAAVARHDRATLRRLAALRLGPVTLPAVPVPSVQAAVDAWQDDDDRDFGCTLLRRFLETPDSAAVQRLCFFAVRCGGIASGHLLRRLLDQPTPPPPAVVDLVVDLVSELDFTRSKVHQRPQTT